MPLRRHHLIPLAAAALLPLLAVSCKKVPEGVLPQEEMARLMADTYMGEGVVDMNPSQYSDDSSRMVLRQTIYRAHGLDQAGVDRSFDWYGNHIEEYIKVIERTEEILKERQKELTAAATQQFALSGDSVDVWPGARHITVNRHLPSRYITFSINADTTWRRGDTYELRYKIVSGQRSVDSRMFVDYAGGVTRMFRSDSRGDGIASVRLRMDTTMTPERLYGYIDLDPRADEHFQIDSISLLRVRAGRNIYLPPGRELRWNPRRQEPEDTAASGDGANGVTPAPSSANSATGVPVQASNINVPAATAGPGALPQKPRKSPFSHPRR